MRPQPGSPTAFEALVDEYEAGRPRYPAELFDALPALAGRDVLELGTGTGIATGGLLERGARVVMTDLGPTVLRHAAGKHAAPAVVARAEHLPFADASFDAVTGAQMWHWTGPGAVEEVVRVLRPGGWLALWWNEVAADGAPWWDAQQRRLEERNPRYTRYYRSRDYGAELRATGDFADVERWTTTWERTIDWPTYESWLRSKSYVQALDDVERFVEEERESLAAHFPDGRVVEPFRTVLWVARPVPH